MLENYFEDLKDFDHGSLFEGIVDKPWESIPRIPSYISEWFRVKEDNEEDYQSMLTGATFHKVSTNDTGDIECMIVVQYPIRISKSVFLKPWNIYIGEGTLLESNTIIKSPAIIGNNCQIRHTAYLRGNVIMGNESVAGHSTEVKNAVFMNNACAGHFAYIGDSILGNHTNLGAGTKLANLQFRSPEEKKSGNIRSIVIKCNQQIFETGLQKFGSVLGDFVETGCNSVIAPGVLLGKKSWVYPGSFVKKGVYKPNSHIMTMTSAK